MIIIKNKTVKIGLLLTLIIVASNLFFSCQATKAMRMLFSEDVKSQHIEYKDKEIIFAPLIHFGKVIYYDNLTDSIKYWKEEGKLTDKEYKSCVNENTTFALKVT